jgi:hypothetical protein
MRKGRDRRPARGFAAALFVLFVLTAASDDGSAQTADVLVVDTSRSSTA